MDYFSICTLLLLYFATLCIAKTPEMYGFTETSPGKYYKDAKDAEGPYKIMMNIDAKGVATYQRSDDKGTTKIENPGKIGLPIRGLPVKVTTRHRGTTTGLFETAGKFYKIKYSGSKARPTNKEECKETLVVEGLTTTFTKAVGDEFYPECQEAGVSRPLFNGGNILFVGGVQQNFCVYGHTDLPNQLFVIQDGKCQVNTYFAGSDQVKFYVFSANDCKKVKELIKSVQDVLGNPNPEITRDAATKSTQKLENLVQELGEVNSSSSSSSSSSEQSTPKKKHRVGFLRRLFRKLWHLIKNIFRISTFRWPKKYN